MRFCLLTTTDLKASRAETFRKLIESIAEECSRGVDAELRVLVQNCDLSSLERMRQVAPDFVRLAGYPGKLSLSRARNKLLNELPVNFLDDDVIIAYPDDDCWYPPNFLMELSQLFIERRNLDLFVCRFSSQPLTWDRRHDPPRRGWFSAVVRATSSNNMFFRGAILADEARFDESLGLGARYNGGEDTDFVIRAFLVARSSLVSLAPLVGHPETSIETLSKYYCGTTLAIAKHVWRRPVIQREFVRKLAVGLVLLVRREISIADFLPPIARVLGITR